MHLELDPLNPLPLREIHDQAGQSGDYWYLAGPMSGYPAFNFPAFDAHAAALRKFGYKIVSPAELDSEEERARCLASPDGGHEALSPNSDPDKLWRECLTRDLNIVMHERCVGVIVMDGWIKSKGARLETGVADAFGKPICAVELVQGRPYLMEIDRADYLRRAGYHGSVA